jgi:hypothetical protein
MSRALYSDRVRAIRHREDEQANTPEGTARRWAAQVWLLAAVEDTRRKYGTTTPDNFDAVNNHREAYFADVMREVTR